MTAEEAFAEISGKLDMIDAQLAAMGYLAHEEAKQPLRIPADELPKKGNVVGLAVLTALFWIGLWAGLRVITFLAGRYL